MWAAVAVLMLLADAYSLLNFYAAADLGYDMHPGGKSILAFWGYATVGCFAGLLIASSAALYCWRASRRASTGRKKT